MAASTPTRIGKYDVFPAFAHGGMASVHVGRLRGPSGFSKLFAIKRLNPVFATSDRHARMLLEEARVTARIRSPYVAAVIEVVHEDDQLCIVMELVVGVSLAQLLAAAGVSLAPGIAVAIVADVLRGLHAAHEAADADGRPLEIVHRDVSPQNIMVGTDGVARVLDFGVARALGREQLSATGEVHGKIAYMAPEQLRGATVTRQADVYAAGVVLWEALVGERLRKGTDPVAVVAAIADPVASPSSKMPSLPRGIDEVVAEALASDQRRRFANADAMAVALEEACPPATRDEVARVVQRVGDRELEHLAEAIRRAERHEALDPPPGTRPSRPRRFAGTAVAVVAMGAAAAFAAVRSARTPAAAPVVPVATEPAATVAVAPVVSIGAVPEPVATTAMSTNALPTKPASRTPAPRRNASQSKSASCTPPYEFDADGNKHFKPECIP
jgi:serine/threonine-protein kinase